MRKTIAASAAIIAIAIAIAIALAAPGQAHEPNAATASKPAALPAAARDAAAVVDAFHAALVRGDTAAALALLADDVLIYEGGRAERSKAEYASHHLGGDAAFAKAVTRAVVRRSGDAAAQMAWIATEGTSTGNYRDRAINSVTTETMVLRREGQDWRIVHIQWSSADRK